MRPVLPSLALAAVLSTSALAASAAGSVGEFESEFRHMYADYRTALFATNAGNQDGSVQSMTSLSEAFFALRDQYGKAPPPHYVDDDEWSTTMEKVAGLLAQSAAEVGAGDLADAHETLEGVRDAFSALHLRNGLMTFSDRMNAYHAEMEAVLGMDLDATDVGTMREMAAVLDYLSRDIRDNPPPEATANSAAFEKLADAVTASVDSFLGATRSGDMAKVKAAVAGLKKPYSQLFLKFG